MKRMTWWALAMIGLSGCGDVLAGTWTTTSLPNGLSALLPSGTTFKGTLSMSNGKNATWSEAYTAPASADSCVTTNEYTGTYTANGTAITYTFTSGTTTITACTDASKNAVSAPSSPTLDTEAGGTLSGSYVALANSLNISGSYNAIPFQWSFGK
jgi:hypothetical protein